MLIAQVSLSAGGGEVFLTGENGENAVISLADARKVGLIRYADHPEELPAEADGEMIAFLARKFACVKYGVYLLGFSDKSRRAVNDKMRQKGYEEDVREAALTVLEASGVIDDGRLCASRVRALAESKRYGPRRIKTELMAKGFPSGVVDVSLDDAAIDWFENALAAAKGLIRRKKPETREEIGAFKQKLARMGYGYDTINDVCGHLLSEADD